METIIKIEYEAHEGDEYHLTAIVNGRRSARLVPVKAVILGLANKARLRTA